MSIKSYLIDEGGATVYTFQYNPERLEYSRKANYSEAITSLSPIPDLQYVYSDATQLSIPNLLLETRTQGISLRPKLQALDKLLEIDGRTFSPKVLNFRMGSKNFGRCVLTSISYTETSWLEGEPVTARVNMALKLIPRGTAQGGGSNSGGSNRNITGFIFGAPKPQLLTDRQRYEGLRKANTTLQNNVRKLPKELNAIVSNKKYTLEVDPRGKVKLNSGGQKLLLGGYNGKSLNLDVL